MKMRLRKFQMQHLLRLQTSYKGEDKVKKVYIRTLKDEFESLNMKESNSIFKYFLRVISYFKSIKKNAENL